MESQTILVVFGSFFGLLASAIWCKYGSPVVPFILHGSKPKRAADPTGLIHVTNFPPSRAEYADGSGGIIPAREKQLSSYGGLGTLTTPTGFSVADIRKLGDFPDYARLSGIRLPEAYPEYDFNKSTPRPYRPFRWPHHQTMSSYHLQYTSSMSLITSLTTIKQV